ncbi:hypothetical protein DL764_003973 [Monosporascus ibericus]|uniref:Phosphoinositide phospholipase C n=1 Tax=Monosporascus ibericus TaxID=155417 RepID=A0A4Q4TIW9_9PEZI|nr:hypothetical protein DL764_003973 [Monosporascus ibericus]
MSSASNSARLSSESQASCGTPILAAQAQPSPDPHVGRDVEQFPPTPFALGEPLMSRRPSNNSMNPSITPGLGSMAGVMADNSGKGLIRRLSNKAQKFARTRRRSSAAPNSRDGSIGPGIIRRRSDSTSTVPPGDAVLFTDSDDEPGNDQNEQGITLGAENMTREFSSSSNAASVAGSLSTTDTPSGPIIPLALIKGTYLSKVSKKNKHKQMFFVLESDAGKIAWGDRSRSLKSLYIDDIKEIRIGSDIRQYRRDLGIPESEESRFFTILYSLPDKSKNKTMHLIAEDEETFAHWVTALHLISKHREDQMASLMAFNDHAVRSYWNGEIAKQAKQSENRQHSGIEEEMDFRGVERVCRNLHIHIAQKDLQAKFAIADTNRSGRLNFSQFQTFVREMKRREDIRPVYLEYAADPEKGLTWPEFEGFLREVQCEDITDGNYLACEARFIRFSRRYRAKNTEFQGLERDSVTMCEEAFAAYLTSKDNHQLVRAPPDYSFDRPINEYFISSSHNTYLVGRQFADVSSIEGYITTLIRGCRSVEIDCWDGSDGQPTVKHGYAMTNPILFREVIHTINKYAFVASRFPLWVSLEVHCGAPQQEIMAETMKEIFGPRLVVAPLDPSSDKLPSPTQLMERILIKVKRTHRELDRRNGESSGRRRGNSLTSPFAKPVSLDNSSIPPLYLSSSPHASPSQNPRRMVSKRVETITEGEVHEVNSSSTSEVDSDEEKMRGNQKTSKIFQRLGELGVYCTGVKFHGFESPDCKLSNHILSFMEGTFRKHSKTPDSKMALMRHNMRYLMRVYPQYTRVSSNNFNPLLYWRRGVQMAALNWQTFDLGMQMNQAMFDGGTDSSGYVLKPESMREIRILPDGLPREAVGKLERQNMTFTIKVISAQQLMRPAGLPANRSLDPYVEVEVFHTNDKRDKHDSMSGIPVLTDTPLKVNTQVVRENGFNPIFDREFVFNITTKFPELVFIKWNVKIVPGGENPSDRNPSIATYTAKLSNLKQGYRTLPLLDSNGDQYLFSTLFCFIKVYPVTSVYVNRGTSTESIGKFKHIGRTVFNRSSNGTKSSFEKASVDGSLSEFP